jgi:hypothetical protein
MTVSALMSPDTDYASLEALRRTAGQKLDFQAVRARRFQWYYDAEMEIIALLDTQERQTFRKLLRESAANWCELVVNAVAERLQVTGFRFAGAGASDLAWQIWQASRMDADSRLVQTDALVTGQSFVLVQPDDDGDNPTGVCITAESPFEATVLYAPGDRRKRIAGYKRFGGDPQTYWWPSWIGEPSYGLTEVLITPDVIATWLPGGGSQGPVVEANPSGLVGMIELVPQPRTWGPPRSELNSAVSIQDRINTLIFNRLVAADYGSFRQIWATGVKIARQVMTGTDPDGSPTQSTTYISPYDIGANRLLANENPAAKFGSFPESTLAGYLAAVDQDIRQLAAITQTPPHYLVGSMANLAADAIKAAEAGLVAKVEQRASFIGEGWEEVLRTAFAVLGHSAADDVEAEVLWRDFEVRSEGQLVDALMKMRTLGVPIEVLWRKWGASPQEIDQWRQLRVAELAGPQIAPGPAPGITRVTGLTPAEPAAPPNEGNPQEVS